MTEGKRRGVEMLHKFKATCEVRFSKENVLHKLSHYATRILEGLVWIGVLWSFLTCHTLPRPYAEYLRSRTPKLCTNSVEVASADVFNFLPQLGNESVSLGEGYQVVSVTEGGEQGQYQVVLLHQNSLCLNVYEFKEFTLLVNSSAGTDGNGTTDSLLEGTETVDLLDVLKPDLSTDLLDFPVGHLFAFVLLLVVSSVFGVLAKWIFLPPLIGMILAGFILRNVPGIDFARHISNNWSSAARNVALVIVLTRGGLSMDLKQLKRLKLAVLLLAFLPCILEGIVDGTIANFWLRLPWQFSFTLG